MKLALLIRSLDVGGAERQAVELATAMSARGHSLALFTFYSGGALESDARARGIEIVTLNRRGWWDFPIFLIRLAREIRKWRPNVLYSYCEIPNIAAVLIRPFIRPCRIVWGLRNNMTILAPSWFSNLLSNIMPHLSSWADAIIANSEGARELALRQGYNSTRFSVLGNCINIDWFISSNSLRTKSRSELGVLDSEILIGNIGIREGKGTEDFLLAAAKMLTDRSDLKFLIVGKDATNFIRQLSLLDELNIRARVIALDTINNIVSIYNAIDLLCSASHGEGFPNVIAEAMACGKACVVTDVGESAKIVGSQGIVVPAGQPLKLADALTHLIENSARFGNPMAIRQQIIQEYSPAQIAEKTELILQEILNQDCLPDQT